MKSFLSLLMAFAVALPALAQPAPAIGEVRRINEKRKEVTLKHGPIPSLSMDAMTMAFTVKDPALLKGLKPGDKVRFQAEMIKKEPVVTKIEVIK
jgi:Cu(I)/Ag(I) efflux system protein CusF